jgi:hypothetical protein
MEEVGPVGLEMVDWTKMAAYNTAVPPLPNRCHRMIKTIDSIDLKRRK